MDAEVIQPQPWQERVLRCSADIAIMGGAAYAGKTFTLLLEPLHHVGNPQFGAVAFRRTYKRITQEGGMWDEAFVLYPPVGAKPNKGELSWHWPAGAGQGRGASLSFAHLQHEEDKLNYYGAQICLLLFDQLEEFSESQFFYMLIRNRSTCGVRPYCRASCNPDPDSWLRRFLLWWIDEDTGLPRLERSGVIRWFIRLEGSDELAWADRPEALYAMYGRGPTVQPKSVTYYPGTMDDNPLGRSRDPGYEANLMLQPRYMRERMRYGNWNARPTAGQFFQGWWFKVVDYFPPGVKARYWDLAASEPTPAYPDPDYTVGVLVSLTTNDQFYVGDVRRARVSPAGVEQLILNTAEMDGPSVEVGIEQEPGAGGKSTPVTLCTKLAARGIRARVYPKRIKTELAAGSCSSAAELGCYSIMRAGWNKAFVDELEGFPGPHDDQVVALTGAHGMVTKTLKGQLVGSRWQWGFSPLREVS